MHVLGYHEHRGGYSVPWGKNLLLFEYPTVLNTPHGTQDIPHGTHDISHGTEHPKVLSSPTVLHTHYTGCLPWTDFRFVGD